MKTTIYKHKSGLSHNTGFSHPENAHRLEVLLSLINEAPFSSLPRKDAKPASEETLCLAHPYYYVQRVLDSLPDRGHARLDGDTILSPGSWQAAVEAAGAVCDAVDDIISGQTIRAFCLTRPPGHHAEPAKSMGFCLFNNIFIGARHAQERHGIPKVAIVDFDVHHGNGTDVMTRNHDGSILFASTQQSFLWPATGLEEDNEPCVMNFGLPQNSGSDFFRTTYEKKIFPVLEDFKPDLLMISAGFDAHRSDPLAQINLETEDYGWITQKLCDIADRHAGGRIVSVLEGGYDPQALRESAAAHLSALAGL